MIGPGDRITLPSFVNLMKFKRIPKLINHGKDTLAVTPPQDVARAQVFLAEYGHSITGQIYNVTGHPILYKWVFKYIADYYGVPAPTYSIPLWLFYLFFPLLYLIKALLKKNQFIQEAFSTTALNFMGKSFKYTLGKNSSIEFRISVFGGRIHYEWV